MTTQNEVLLAALKKQALTTGEIAAMGIGRPADRVLDLKAQSHHIHTEMVDAKTRWGVSKVALYTLLETAKAA